MLSHLLPSLAWCYHIAQHSLRPLHRSQILPCLCTNRELVLLCKLPAGCQGRIGTSAATHMGTGLGTAQGCPPTTIRSAELTPDQHGPQHRPAGLQEPVLGRMAGKHQPLSTNQQRAASSWPFPHLKGEQLGKGHPWKPFNPQNPLSQHGPTWTLGEPRAAAQPGTDFTSMVRFYNQLSWEHL